MQLRKPYVLVVSADWERGQEWCETLAQEGFSAFVCSSAREALCAPRPEVLITEFDLPDHDGLELCEALSAGASPVAMVLAIEEGSLDLYRRALALGIQQLLPLEATEEEIRTATQEALDSQHPERHQGFEAQIASTAPAAEQTQRDLSAWLLVRGIAPSTRCRIVTALGEALENVRFHAYEGDVGPIDVEASLEGVQLELVITDRGEGTAEDTLQVALRGQGSGLARMAALSEDVSVVSHPTFGTCVRLSFNVHRARFSEFESTEFEDFDFLAPDHVRALLQGLGDGHNPDVVHLSPAVAVTVGRLLAGPGPFLVHESPLAS